MELLILMQEHSGIIMPLLFLLIYFNQLRVQGTAYLTAFRDKEGAYLDGGKNYKLTVPANAPVKRFWAVTAYDPTTRGLLDAGGNTNKSVGSHE